jgi:type IV secretion system protein VirD4
LIEVRLGDWDVRDVENVADVLVDPESSLDKRNRCKKTCHSQLVGALQRSSKELW